MSRFLNARLQSLIPYTPGEQPRGRTFIRLNTNELPWPPPERAVAAARANVRSANLYSDPDCVDLTAKLAELNGLKPEQIIVTNGSDEVLNFAFIAFCGPDTPALFPNITYAFYPVFAGVNGIPYEELPLNPDFTVDLEAYKARRGTVFLANPNAPTGLALPVSAIEALLAADPDRVVVVDEAYVDFHGVSCAPLIDRYPNLLVTRTFSKSRGLAGARLGFGMGSRELITDLHTIRNSTNPYNVNSATQALGLAMLEEEETTAQRCAEIMAVRDRTVAALRELGFTVTDSRTNFLFARSDKVSGADLFAKLRERGILIRHFARPETDAWNRITVGTAEQMEAFLAAVREILKEAD